MINADHHVESDELMLSDRHRGSANFNGGAGDQGITESSCALKYQEVYLERV
jgi:hypothetical protein